MTPSRALLATGDFFFSSRRRHTRCGRDWSSDVCSSDLVEGKKVYEITDAGRKFLDEHRDMVDDIFDRVREAVDRTLGGAMGDVNRSLGRLVKAVYRTGGKARDDATRQRLVEILDRMVGEVEGLVSGAD